ncbi:hypothetical protein CQW23_06081 [Capsicum baccatum]|uniref:Uncharacterized protein n=1 Tax=Capsicum baccatum TaxID=33114 RepID=A0A2G2X2G1_CAPBA|nr:hypothetical protein CQW23_06081 [Capsicum baccatum]
MMDIPNYEGPSILLYLEVYITTLKFHGPYGIRGEASNPSVLGPKFRAIGNIVLSFKDSPSAKVGVQFDKPIPRGINLGGLCEDAHRFFSKEDTGLDDLENLLVKPLFEVVSSESINSPVILFMKDAAKSVEGNLVSYSTYKSRLEELLDNVVIIGSHAQTNKHKEKDSFQKTHDKGKKKGQLNILHATGLLFKFSRIVYDLILASTNYSVASSIAG